MRSAVALWRLARAVLHVLHGMGVMAFRFPHLDAAGRQARIGWWSAGLLRVLGVELLVRQGSASAISLPAALVVANHVSWLDIAAIHAVLPQARFVSKAEVLRWPLLGRLIRGAGTLFIERESKRDAVRVLAAMRHAMAAGHTVAVFPEGTTGTGPLLLPFHANLLQAAVLARVPIQPVALRYADTTQRFSAAVHFVGDTTLAQNLWQVALASGLKVHVELLPVVHPSEGERRVLAVHIAQSIQDRLSAG